MLITEGSARLEITAGKVTKKLPVFYNPVMKLNRDLSVLLLQALGRRGMQVALPLAGTGVRGIRFLKELPPDMVEQVYFNDYKAEQTKRQLELNGIYARFELSSKDANLFLLEGKGFDYIDIDPFGSPNPFLDAAVVRLARNGILAVTATDTAALSGSSRQACLRKYWALPLKNEFMHETGLRILIRKVQLIGAQHEKALMPIFSYSKDHYYRIFFLCEKGRKKADALLVEHKYLLYDPKTAERRTAECLTGLDKRWEIAGPLWTGRLWEPALVEKMHGLHDRSDKKLSHLLSHIKEECRIDAVGFYDLHKMAKIRGEDVQPIDSVIKKGVSRTHFLGWGVRTKVL